MRPTVLVLALALSAPFALAANSATWSDPVGDGWMAGGLVEASVCPTEAVDITGLSLATDDETLRVGLTVSGLRAIESGCTLGQPVGEAGYFARWHEAASGDPAASPFGVHAQAWSTGLGIEGCVHLDYADTVGGCLGRASIEGASVVWTMPVAGIELVEVADDPSGTITHTEARPYDLRGFVGEAGANTALAVETLTGIGIVGDDIEGGVFTG